MARSVVSTLLTLSMGLAGLWVTALPASAAPVLTITPITWNVVGLDHNQPVTSGPDTFASGARVCNTGDATATNVVSNYVWDTTNPYINTTGLSSLSVASLAAGACTDFYYNIVITRSALAYGQTRRFHITATADGLGTVSTPTPREIYVEQLRSQNRNQIVSITGPSNVVVGNTYTYVLTSNTSSTFEQWSSFLNFPNFAFQIVSVGATYTQPAGATNSTIYADACGFQQNPTLPNYRECVGPAQYPGGAVGGTAVTTYQVKILSAGAFSLNALIYDKSGGSYHYNSDWGNGGNAVTAVEEVDLSITKSDSADPIIAGNDLTYTLDVTNAGPSTAHNVSVSDPLPAGTSFVSASNGGTNVAGTVTWSIGDLPAGASVSRTLTVNVNSSRTTPLSNTATVSTTTTDTNNANNSVTQGTTVNTSADLSLTKSDAADPVARGSNVSYTLTASNAGPSDAQSVQITDTLPASVSFVSATPSQGSCNQAAGTVTCSLGTIAASGNATVAIVITPNVDGAITNTASVSSTTNDPSNANNSASQGTTITPRADVSVTKTDSADPVTAGNNLTYTITATNNGPSTAANVQITDPVPTGTTFVSASDGGTESGGTVTWNLGSLTSGQSVIRTLTVQVHASRTNPVSNTATVSTTTTDPNNANDSATQGTTVNTSADLSIVKTDSADPVGVGSNLSYTLAVSNAGPSDAAGVQVSDPLPAGVSYVSATPSQGSCNHVAGTVTCPLGALAAGANATVTVVVTPTTDGALSNTASVSATTSDPDVSNNGSTQGTTVNAVANLSISKSDSADPITAGTDLTYTITLTNVGPSTAQNVQVTDAVPAGTSFVSASNGGTEAAGTVTWNLGPVASGAVITRTVVVHVDEDRVAPLSNTAQVTTSTGDPDLANNSVTEPTAVATSADLSVSKTDAADPVAAGDDVTYTIAVTNAGPSNALGVEVLDTLPAGIVFGSATPSQGSCNEAGGTVSCSLGTLADGASATITVVVTTTVDATLSNTVSVDATTPDPAAGNDSDTETTEVTPVSDLSLAKTDAVGAVVAGTPTTYTLTLTNHGPSVVPAGVEVTDAFPPGTTGSESDARCSISGGALTCTTTAGLAVGASTTFQLELDLDPDYPDPDLVNTASITDSPHADPDNTDDSDTDTDAVDTEADLAVDVDDDADPVNRGDDVTYTVTVDNLGPSDAQGVVVAAPIPAATSFVSATGGCAPVLLVVTCSVPTLGAGGSMSFDIVVTPTVDGVVTQDVGVASSTTDPNPANDDASESTTVIAQADLSVVKTDDLDPVGVGSDLTYTLTVHNDGPSTATDVEVVDDLPGSMSFVSASHLGCAESGGTVTCDLGDLADGGTVVIDVVVTPTADGVFTNEVSVDSPVADPDATDDEDTQDTTVTPVADLELTKDDGALAVTAGTSTTYTLTLTNHGPSPVPAGVEITDAIPAGTTVSAADPACAPSGGDLVCTTTGVLASGASVGFDVTLDVDPGYADPDLVNTAGITASPLFDPDNANDTATDTDVVDAEADLSVDVDDDVDPVDLGDDVTYTITVDNLGPSDAAGVEVDVVVPAGLAFSSADPGCSVAAGVVTCVVGGLAAGGSASFDVVLTTTIDGTVSVDATVSSSTLDANAVNDSATEATGVDPVADVSISKVGAPDPVGVGEVLTYTLTVHNDGPSTAEDVTVTDVLPAVLTFVSATPSTGSCTELAGTVTCDLGDLLAGATETIDIVANPTDDGVVANTATVDTVTTDPDASNDASVAGVTVTPVADLEVTKTDGLLAVVAGGSTTYTITLTNHGPSDVPAGVEVTDTLPADATGSHGEPDCGPAGTTITCVTSADLAVGASVSWVIDVDVDADAVGPTVSNGVAVTSSSVVDPDASNDAATDVDVLGHVADLGVDIVSDAPDPVVLGNDVTYTIDVDNAGPSDAALVEVDLPLPAGLVFSSGDPECSFAGGSVTCELANLAASDSHMFTVVLSPVATGTMTLPASVSSSAADPNPANDDDTEDTLVNAPPVVDADLSVSIDDDADPVTVGGAYGYTISVTNDGPANAVGVELEHVLPPGASFVSATTSQGSCSESGGTVTCPLGAMGVGVTVTIDVDVTAPGVTGDVDSTVAVTSLSPDPDGSNDTDGETTTIQALSADLSIVKTDGATEVTAGGWTTYTLTVSNAGPHVAPAGVVITDAVPLGTTAVESDADCDVALGTLTCTTDAPLAVGGSVVYSFDLVVDGGYADPTLTNTAEIASSPVGDPDASNDMSTDVDDVVTRADLSVSIDDTPDPVVLGNDVTYTLTVTNDGPSDASDVVVSSVLPAQLTFVSAPGCTVALDTVTCSIGPFAAGASTAFDLVLHPTVSGIVALDATVSSTTLDPDPMFDSDTEATTVLAPPPLDVDLGASLTDAPDPVLVNGALVYTLSVTNAGPGDADNVALTQQLPGAVTFASADPGCGHAVGVVTCAVGTVASGATVSRVVTVTAPAAVQVLNSTLTVGTTSNDPNAANDTSNASTAMQTPPPGPASADLGVTVADTPDPVVAGGSVTYSVGVTNAGPDDATSTVVTFTLPAGGTFTNATPAQGSCTHAAGIVTCNLGTVASGGSTSISIAATLTAVGVATATATVSSSIADPNATNDTATTSTTVTAAADLSIVKTDGVTSVAPGASTTYTITLSNAGPSPAAAGVVVVDHVPAGTTASTTNPNCSVAGSDVTCTTTAALAVGASVSWQITVDVPVTFTGTALDNTAEIQVSPTTDPDAANDTSTDHDDVAAPTADLSIFKLDEPDPVNAGERITYTITVTNDGPGTAEDVVVTDNVPSFSTIEEIQDGGTESGGVVTWSLGSLAAGESVSVQLIVLVDVDHDGDVTNVASVASTTTDPDPSDNSATAVTTDDPVGVDLEIEKSADAKKAAIGDTITYEIVVTNQGPADATGVVVEDALPDGLEYVSAQADQGSYDGDTGEWLVGDLAADQSATLEIETEITASAAGTLRNVAVVASLDQTDPTPANDEAEAEVEVLSSNVEIVDPIDDEEELAFTGLRFGAAAQAALLLLILGISLTVLGRRLERSSRRDGE